MKKITVLLLVLLCVNLYAESDNELSFITGYGLFAHYGLNVHKANFYQLPNIPSCCPKYDIDARQSGYQLGALIEFALPYRLAVGLRVEYDELSADLKRNEFTYVKVNDLITKGTFTHHLNTTIDQLEVLPYISYSPIDFISIAIGPKFGNYVTKQFNQYEEIASPSSGVFSDTKTKIRNNIKKDLPNLNNTMVSMSGILSFNFPLNKDKTLLLSPEIEVSMPLNTVIDKLQWKIYSEKAGLALLYRPGVSTIQQVKENNKTYKIDTIKIESRSIKIPRVNRGIETSRITTETTKEKITVNETVYRTDTLMIRKKPEAQINSGLQAIHVKTQLVTQAFQNISVVFFDRNNSNLPQYYNILKTTEHYSIDTLENSAFSFHKNILNIIGQRMSEYPSTKIALEGNIDSTTEGNNCTLAMKRAETVRNYLTSVWNIDRTRIEIDQEANCYPKNKAITKNDSAYAENRRVNIITQDAELLAPIYREHFLELLDVQPDTLSLKTDGSSTEDITSWILTATQGDNDLIFKMEGQGQPDKIIKKKIDNDFAKRFLIDKKIEIGFGIIDSEGMRAGTSQTLNIIRDTSEYEVSRLSIILFDIASDKISDAAEKELEKFLKNADETTTIRITGYSDILGTEVFNKGLSQRRADKVASLCTRLAPKAEIASVKGVGAEQYPSGIHSYSTCPERFFSRTVEIEVLKKLQK